MRFSPQRELCRFNPLILVQLLLILGGSLLHGGKLLLQFSILYAIAGALAITASVPIIINRLPIGTAEPVTDCFPRVLARLRFIGLS